MTTWAPWLLSTTAVLVVFLAGSEGERGRRRRLIAWSLGFVNEAIWTIYSVGTRQWGFLVSVVVFTAVYVRNLRTAIKAAPENHS